MSGLDGPGGNRGAEYLVDQDRACWPQILWLQEGFEVMVEAESLEKSVKAIRSTSGMFRKHE